MMKNINGNKFQCSQVVSYSKKSTRARLQLKKIKEEKQTLLYGDIQYATQITSANVENNSDVSVEPNNTYVCAPLMLLQRKEKKLNMHVYVALITPEHIG